LDRLDTFLHQEIHRGTIPGAVICVAHRGQVVWHRAYGAAALVPQPRPMHCDTLFDVASLTKVVATTSLMLVAHHHGVCMLDERLSCFYPHLTNTAWSTSTMRHILTHRGGFAAWYPLYQELLPAGPEGGDSTSARERRQQAARAILQRPLAYTPGTQTVYSDLGFIVLGDILETQYQQSLERLFLEYVAQPLGLHAIAYRPLGGQTPLPSCPTAYAATEACPWRGRVLTGEVHDENAWALGGVAGHAGVFATAAALWQFVHALLETAAGRRQWLPPALLRDSWQRCPAFPDSSRALGWDTPTPGRSSAGDYFSRQSIGHLGFTGTSLWIDREHQVTVVLCTNRVHPTRHTTGITRLRPAVHNHIMHALGVAPS
jgi:CubicO group peptidase (beta-lactamase class C family)